jgi:hypothetical protein
MITKKISDTQIEITKTETKEVVNVYDRGQLWFSATMQDIWADKAYCYPHTTTADWI